MMRELTPEQKALMATIEWPLPPPTAEELAAIEAAKVEADRLRAEAEARYDAEMARREEAIRPLKEALRSAGIKLALGSYEGIWGRYQIGNGRAVEVDVDGLDTFDD